MTAMGSRRKGNRGRTRPGPGRWLLRGLLGLAAGLALAACTPPPADSVLVVTTTDDTVDATPGDGICADSNGDCSLRAAVMEANSDPDVTEIQLTGGQYYMLTIAGRGENAAATGDLDITQPTYVRANTPGGTGLAVVDAGGLDRIFEIHAGAFHYFEGLHLTGGDAGNANGGGISVHAGLVGIEDTRLIGNLSGGSGGGLWADGGRLWVEDSTIDNNAAGGPGGAVAGDSAFIRLFQATVADNLSDFGGGQVAGLLTDSFGTDVHLVSSTIGGDENAVLLIGSRVTLTNTILNTAETNCSYLVAEVVSGGNNVVGDSSCGLSGAGDVENRASRLKPLAYHGGLVPTMLPSFGSPALDKVPAGATGCTTPVRPDARQQPRPSGVGCDAGAVENQPGETTGRDCLDPPFVGPAAELQFCDLSDMVLGAVDLTDADLTGAVMPGVDLEGALLQRVAAGGADLTSANLLGARVADSDLTAAVLTGTDLTGAIVEGSDLVDVSGSAVVLFGARITDVDARNTDLVGADLRGAIITRVDLSGADLLFADLTGAVWSDTTCPDGTNSDNNGSTCEGHRF